VTSTTTPTETIDVGEQKPATTRTVLANTRGIAVGASMIIPGFGQFYANAVRLGVIFVVAWTIPFWLILFSFPIPGLTSLGQGAPLDGVPPEGIPPGVLKRTALARPFFSTATFAASRTPGGVGLPSG
jgi:TM2 domain-containing membrane protein YozV